MTTTAQPAATPAALFHGDFERVHDRLAGRSAKWLDELRKDAVAALLGRGFPSVRDEDWKYTSVLPLLRDRLEPVLPGDAEASDAQVAPLLERAAALAASDSPRIVFVDGIFRASLSRVDGAKGLRLSSLRERLDTEPGTLEPLLGKFLTPWQHGFAALNTAFLDDGAVVEIGEGRQLGQPLHVVYLSSQRERPFVTHPRNVIVAAPGSSALVVEHYLGAGSRSLTNAATEIVVARDAVLGHLRIQDEEASAFHIARVEVQQQAGSSFVSHAFGLGAALSRTEISVRLGGEEAECRLFGLYATDGSRHMDHHLSIDHAKPRTRSEQLYKGVLDDKSRGVFTGRVLVRPDAQKIRAMQKNPSLLLGTGAVAETRPQLEIYADDVACNHGASIGRLDDDALFYLLSRGIDAREARRLLVGGFAGEIVESIAAPGLRESVGALVAQRIADLGQSQGSTQS